MNLFLSRTLAMVLAIVVIGAVLLFPVGNLWLCLGLMGYTVFQWLIPPSWLFFIPVLLALLDLAPLSGWFFLNAFDLFLIMTIAVFLWKRRTWDMVQHLPVWATLITTMLSLCCIVSAFRPLVSLPSVDANSFSNYYSPYNCLRAAKGYFSALALLPLLRRDLAVGVNLRRYFIPGVLVALMGVAVVAIWERHVTFGVFDFDNDYRVTATFSGMHTGGACIDGFLALFIPFIVCCFISWKNKAMAFGGTALFAASLYVLMVTYSRIDYAAFGVSFTIMVLGLWWIYSLNKRVWNVLVLLVCVCGVVVTPVIKGNYIQARFSHLIQDVELRIRHWGNALDKMPPGMTVSLFGAGPGSYPKAYFNRSHGKDRPGTYGFYQENNNLFLRLTPGVPLYFGQRIPLVPGHGYTLGLDVRSNDDDSILNIPICEKLCLYSFKCRWVQMDVGNTQGQWVHKELSVPTLNLGKGTMLSRRPVEFGLCNVHRGKIDIDNLFLINTKGENFIVNGDFSKGMNRWFFHTDNYLPWHIDNLWVSLLFEQGWMGLILFNTLIAGVLISLAGKVLKKDLFALVLLSSLTGFLTVGVIASLFDFPRMTMLFLLTVFVALLQPGIYSIPK